ncbi:MAG TPA: glycosyltransferase family 9 protein [Candidatus Acidoferrum sp.]|nr:glycosyltransferase family 9 protein [Candidatus Acidoferrum sp.]
MKRNDSPSLLTGLPPGSEILILRLRSLGDIVLETSALAALHSWRPDLRLSVLVEPWCAAALAGNPHVSEIILSRASLATVAAIRSKKFSAVFNQHGGPRSALLTAFSGSPARIGWQGYQYSFAYNVPVPDALEFYGRPFVHAVEHRLSQFYFCGLPRGPIPPARVFPQSDAVASVAEFLAGKGIAPGSRYALLQPGARLPGMRWPASHFADVARALRDSHGIASVVNLGPSDAEGAREVRGAMKGVAAIADSFDARQLIVLAAGASIFVGNDSGPAHIAAAVGKPCVVIFGVTNPTQWHPWEVDYRVVSTGAEFRAVRGDKSVFLRAQRSISEIPAEEVIRACDELLAAPAKK